MNQARYCPWRHAFFSLIFFLAGTGGGGRNRSASPPPPPPGSADPLLRCAMCFAEGALSNESIVQSIPLFVRRSTTASKLGSDVSMRVFFCKSSPFKRVLLLWSHGDWRMRVPLLNWISTKGRWDQKLPLYFKAFVMWKRWHELRFASEWGLWKSVHGCDVISGSRRVLLPSMKQVLFLSRNRKSFWPDCIVAVDNAISTERYI